MSNIPLVTVIIPTYNRTSLITRSVESIRNQSYKKWELLIVDDGSTDDTKDVLEIYRKDKRIKYFYTPNKGVCHARNYGMKKAKGEYIFLLDSDDEFLKDKIAIQVREMKKYNAFLSISNRVYAVDGGLQRKNKSLNRSFFIKPNVFWSGTQPLSASFLAFKREVVKSVEFDEILPSTNDLDFVLIAMKFYKLLFVDFILTINHKSLQEPRISTNYEKKIKGYEIVLSKLKKGVYQLQKGDKQTFKKYLYRNIGFFALLEREYVYGRKFLLKYFKAETFLSFKYWKNFFLYILSFIPRLFVIFIRFGKMLWNLRVLRVT